MLASQYAQSMKQKNFFLLPNSVFELNLNKYEMRQKAAAKIDMGIAKAEPQPTEESTLRERTMTTFQARKRWSPKAG